MRLLPLPTLEKSGGEKSFGAFFWIILTINVTENGSGQTFGWSDTA